MKHLPAVLLLALLAPPLAADGFPGNNLLVCAPSSASVRMYNDVGAHVAALDGLGQPAAIELGPDGLLYVASVSDDRVYVVDHFGSRMRIFGKDGAGFSGLAFGPMGTLYVSAKNDGELLEYDRFGTLLRSFGAGLDQPTGLTVGPSGHIFVITAMGVIVELDPSGEQISSLSTPGLTEAVDLLFDGDGSLFVASTADSSVFHFDADGEFLYQSVLSGASLSAITLGPDDRLHCLITFNNLASVLIVEDNGQIVREVPLGIPASGGLRYVPYRLPIKIAGRVAVDGEKPGKRKSDAILSVSPGGNALMLAFDEGDSIFAPFFGDWLVLRGFRANEPFSNRRTIHGEAIDALATDVGTASVVLTVNGKLDDGDALRVHKATGVLLRGDGTEARMGAIKSGKPIN